MFLHSTDPQEAHKLDSPLDCIFVRQKSYEPLRRNCSGLRDWRRGMKTTADLRSTTVVESDTERHYVAQNPRSVRLFRWAVEFNPRCLLPCNKFPTMYACISSATVGKPACDERVRDSFSRSRSQRGGTLNSAAPSASFTEHTSYQVLVGSSATPLSQCLRTNELSMTPGTQRSLMVPSQMQTRRGQVRELH